MSMGFDVVIAAAGAGGRMSEVNKDLHKALLPYLGKPILWHLISGIPKDSRIIILVGFRASQIIDFCTLAFPDKKFAFVEVDDWVSERSGTAYSLLQAKPLLNSGFWYVPCDGVFANSVYSQEPVSDKFWVKNVNPTLTKHYETFACEQNKIVSRFHKLPNLTDVYAFTGVMYISNSHEFLAELEKSGSGDFTDSIQPGEDVEELPSWLDLGNPDEFSKHSIPDEEFDFSKTSEYTFLCSNKVIKWWNSDDVPQLKTQKPLARPEIFPVGIQTKGQFLSYERAPGETFYNHSNPERFRRLLTLLGDKFWNEVSLDLDADLRKFYIEKTLGRINLMNQDDLDQRLEVSKVDGESVMHWRKILKSIPWGYLTANPIPSIIHGDLQFDNIIFDEESLRFSLIDWRPDFGNQSIHGDRYYDYAKLLGGIRLNYSLIKKNKFGFAIENHDAKLSLPTALDSEILEEILREYVAGLGLDFNKVEHLVPIIYWNMAPLHKEPFKSFLWLLGIKYFSRLS